MERRVLLSLLLDCQKVMDVGIVLDSSSSVRRDNYEHAKDFLIKLVDKLPVSHRMTHLAVIHYNHRAYLDWNFKGDVAENAKLLKAAIENMKYQPGGTRTDRALEEAKEEFLSLEKGARPNVPHVLLVITDGKTSKRSKKYQDVLKPFVVIKKQKTKTE